MLFDLFIRVVFMSSLSVGVVNEVIALEGTPVTVPSPAALIDER